MLEFSATKHCNVLSLIFHLRKIAYIQLNNHLENWYFVITVSRVERLKHSRSKNICLLDVIVHHHLYQWPNNILSDQIAYFFQRYSQNLLWHWIKHIANSMNIYKNFCQWFGNYLVKSPNHLKSTESNKIAYVFRTAQIK